MNWKDRCLSFVQKYGSAAKVVAGSVLNVVVPGSGALVKLVETACETAQDMGQAAGEEAILAATRGNTAELQRLGSLFELLSTDLARLCDKAHALHDQPDDLPGILARALAGDRNLIAALQKLELLTDQFACLSEQNRRLLDGQDEMLPVLRRLNRVLPFLEDCWAAGLTPRDIGKQMERLESVVAGLLARQADSIDAVVVELRTSLPRASSVCMLEAGVAAVEQDPGAAQKALTTAVRLRPGDGELIDLQQRATRVATQHTPRNQPRTGGISAASTKRLQPGDDLDGWRLTARLGAGGWGQVFCAQKEGRTCALKVMHPEYSSDPRFVERFKAEIGALFRLPIDPGLVRIDTGGFHYSEERRCWYLRMENVQGLTLEQYLQRHGPLKADQARGLFAPLAESLGKAHAAGVFHRDIKPGNIMVRQSDGRLVLVDFGLATLESDLGQTRVGGISVTFAAPEQFRGQPADARSDVFSLAATINYALFFDRPDLRLPYQFTPAQVPALLRGPLAKAMEQNPAARPAHAQALAALLLSGKEEQRAISQGKESTGERLRRVKGEAARLHEEIGSHLQLHEIEEAAAAFESFTAEQIPFRNDETYRVTIKRRDRLRLLGTKIEEQYAAHKFMDPRLAMWIAEYLQIKPNDAGMVELSKEIPPPVAGKSVLTGALGMKFAYVPAGTFLMGSPASEANRSDDEMQHKVMFSEAYWMGVYPVTVGEFEQFVQASSYRTEAEQGDGAYGWTGSEWKQDRRFNWRTLGFAQTARHPVTSVTWNDAQAMVKWLNEQAGATGLVYSLPTEAQWEYACRGGTQTAYWFGNDAGQLGDYAWFDGNANNQTHPVETKRPNPWGLYHMHGNIWEWCQDWYGSYLTDVVKDGSRLVSVTGGSPRVSRGGGWYGSPRHCRSASRCNHNLGYRRSFLGFRLAVSSVGVAID